LPRKIAKTKTKKKGREIPKHPIFHHFPSFSIIFHHFPSFSIIFHHFPSFSIIFPIKIHPKSSQKLPRLSLFRRRSHGAFGAVQGERFGPEAAVQVASCWVKWAYEGDTEETSTKWYPIVS
jgi:hypothetical protein